MFLRYNVDDKLTKNTMVLSSGLFPVLRHAQTLDCQTPHLAHRAKMLHYRTVLQETKLWSGKKRHLEFPWSFVCSPSFSFAMSILPLFICRVACSAGRSWCRRAGSCSSAVDGDWTDWDNCPEEEEDMVEGVEPKAPGAEFRLWEEEEEEEWPELDDVDWSPDVVSVESSRTGTQHYFTQYFIF